MVLFFDFLLWTSGCVTISLPYRHVISPEPTWSNFELKFRLQTSLAAIKKLWKFEPKRTHFLWDTIMWKTRVYTTIIRDRDTFKICCRRGKSISHNALLFLLNILFKMILNGSTYFNLIYMLHLQRSHGCWVTNQIFFFQYA